jgi:hypothetical protein
MALGLAAVVALLILEDAMPRRKTSPRNNDPADALMKTLHPHAAGQQYVAQGQQQYEQAYQERVLKSLKRKARELGYELTPREQPQPA